jgi:hypothetical protein
MMINNKNGSQQRTLIRLFAWVWLLTLLTGCKRESPDIPFVPYTWEVGSPEEAGMNKQILDSAFIIASQKGYVTDDLDQMYH